MNVVPKGPTSAPQAQSTSAQDSRARAIAMLSGAQPVPNASQVSAEEMGAVKSNIQEPEAEQVQSDSNETQESAPAEATKEPPLSSQYANLARKEKQLRAQIQQFKQQQQAWEAEKVKTSSQPQVQSFDESKYIARDRLKTEALSVLAEEGLLNEQLYSDLTNQILSEQKQDPRLNATLKRLEAQIESTKQAQERSEKAIAEQQTQSYQQAVNQIRNEAKQLVFTDPDFEMVKVTNSVNDVVELIERTFKEDGQLLTVEEAAKQVEEYLIEEGLKLAKSSKIQKRLTPAPRAAASPQSSQTQGQSKQQPQLKTLTNSVGTSRQLTAKERAILAFKGELKSS